MKQLKIELVTDNHDVDIAQTFFVRPLRPVKGRFGVYAQDFNTDSASLIAITSGSGAKREAEKIVRVLESVLLGVSSKKPKWHL